MGSRDHIVSLRLTAAERARLAALAAVHGADQSTVIRTLIDEAPLYWIRWRVPEPARPPVDDLSARLRQRIEATDA